MPDPAQVLNLDQLLGENSPIQVRLRGVAYELRAPHAFGAREHVRFERLQRQLIAYETAEATSDVDDETTLDASAKMIETVIDKLLAMLNADLLNAGLTFPQKSSALKFYMHQVEAQMAPEKKDASP